MTEKLVLPGFPIDKTDLNKQADGEYLPFPLD